MSPPSRGPSSSEADEVLTEVVVTDAAIEEEIPCSEVAVVGTTSEDQLGQRPTPSGIPFFAPSPSLNVFTNIFQVAGMDWMGGGIKEPCYITTPFGCLHPFHYCNFRGGSTFTPGRC